METRTDPNLKKIIINSQTLFGGGSCFHVFDDEKGSKTLK